MKKPRKSARMGGRHNSYIRARIPEEERDAFYTACEVGRKAIPSDILREFADAYCALVQRDGRQPESIRAILGLPEKRK